MKLSDKLIKLRKEKGLSQEELGNELNVSRQAVSKWESEIAKPDIDKIRLLSKFYNVSCDYLLDDEQDEYIEKQSTNFNIKDTLKKMLKHKITKICFIVLVIILILFTIKKGLYLYKSYTDIDKVVNFYRDNYEKIGITKSGIIFEEKTESKGNVVKEIHKTYYYYINGNKKLLKIVEKVNNEEKEFFETTKELYIDLNSSNEYGCQNVIEVDCKNDTTNILNNYTFVEPMTTINLSLNSMYNIVWDDRYEKIPAKEKWDILSSGFYHFSALDLLDYHVYSVYNDIPEDNTMYLALNATGFYYDSYLELQDMYDTKTKIAINGCLDEVIEDQVKYEE